MGWSCPHLVEDNCELHGVQCKPGTGNCILKNRYKISREYKPPISQEKIKKNNAPVSKSKTGNGQQAK